MGEAISVHDIAAVDLTASTLSTVDIKIPTGFRVWTLLIAPEHTGGGVPPDPAYSLDYDVGGKFFVPNPTPAAATATLNKATIISREDAVNRVRLNITPGALPLPDQGIRIRLYGSRS